MTTLIFPSSHSLAMEFYDLARASGEEVVGASSLHNDENKTRYKTWFFLPNIHSPEFGKEFSQAVKKYRIEKVLCPSPQAYTFLKEALKKDKLKVRLQEASPLAYVQEQLRNTLKQAEEARSFIDAVAGGKSTLNELEIPALLKQMTNIYGQSHYAKILAMIGIFAEAPKGDVIEIGVLMGRTSFILNYLARHYQTGKVLAIDPWQPEMAVQKDSPEVIKNVGFQFDWELTLTGMIVNMLPSAAGNFNYARADARKFHAKYSKDKKVTTPEFGTTKYSGKIAVIHIDGNHDYECVTKDYGLWRKNLAKGGWVIIDDYVWQHGDGPKRLGDKVMREEKENIKTAFTAGNALFIKFKK